MVYNKLVAVGSTPTAKTPAADAEAIQNIFNQIQAHVRTSYVNADCPTIQRIKDWITHIFNSRYNDGVNAIRATEHTVSVHVNLGPWDNVGFYTTGTVYIDGAAYITWDMRRTNRPWIDGDYSAQFRV